MATTHTANPRLPPQPFGGFSLIELMLAMGMGLALSGVILQVLITDSEMGVRVNRLLRERSVQKRTLALIRDDVQRSSRISTNPLLEKHACSLAGRLPVLHLTTKAGPITYSVGNPPSAIWRGLVLMRCGPAFGLDGSLSIGSTAQNRVVIDALSRTVAAWESCNTAEEITTPSTITEAKPTEANAGGLAVCITQGGQIASVRLIQQIPSNQQLGTHRISSETRTISRLE